MTEFIGGPRQKQGRHKNKNAHSGVCQLDCTNPIRQYYLLFDPLIDLLQGGRGAELIPADTLGTPWASCQLCTLLSHLRNYSLRQLNNIVFYKMTELCISQGWCSTTDILYMNGREQNRRIVICTSPSTRLFKESGNRMLLINISLANTFWLQSVMDI